MGLAPRRRSDSAAAARPRGLLGAVALALVTVWTGQAQEETPDRVREATRVSARLGIAPQLYLRATDRRGVAILDLRADEIRVQEDGVEREVQEVRLANLPVHLTVLVDNSRGGRATRSAGVQRYLHYRAGVSTLVERLPPYQLVSILPLSGEPRWVLQTSADPDEIREGIESVTYGRDGLHLLDALDETARAIEELRDPSRPVVVIVTGVTAERSEVTQERYDRVVERFLRHGVTVHAVVVTGRRTGTVGNDFVSQVCEQLTTMTGGYHRRVWRTTHVMEQLAVMADRIRARNSELSRQLLIRYDRPEDAPVADTVGVQVARQGVRWELTADGRAR